MAKWIVQDSLAAPEQFFCSHVDSISHWLNEYGEDATAYVVNSGVVRGNDWLEYDVAFMMDDFAAAPGIKAAKRIAQVAAVCSPQPWEVRRPDGSPWFDLVISSIPAMVNQARDAGCKAVYQALAFDYRALVRAAPTKDIDCLFVGTVDANHRKRQEVLAELGDMVTVAPPCWGRDYYRLISRAKVLVHVHAEWATGAANALRLFEGAGMGAQVVSDGYWSGVGRPWWFEGDELGWVAAIEDARLRANAPWDTREYGGFDPCGHVLAEHGYHRRIPQLIEWSRSL